FIAMRFVAGEDLGALVRREGPLDAARAVRLVAQVAEALDAIHAHGLVHRDVKPSNVLLQATGAREHAYVTDFGITKLSSDATPLTDTGAFLGTVDYCAPEVIRGDVLDGRADVYSLGCVLYECLTGEKPFPRDSHLAAIYAHLEDEPPSARDRRPGIPPALDAVVTRALAKDVAQRFQTAGELAVAATAALDAPTRVDTPATGRARVVPAAPAGSDGGARARPGRRGLAAGALAALVAAGIAAAVLGGGSDGGGGPAGSASPVAEDGPVPSSFGRTVVGSTLTQAPGEGGYCSGGGKGAAACTVVHVRLGRRDQALRFDGVITGWAVRGGKGELALRVVDGDPGRRRVVARGPTVRPTGNGIERYSVRLPIKRGQLVGVERGRTGFLPYRYLDDLTLVELFDPPLGASPTAAVENASAGDGYEYLYNATVEPDDDGDGRGDLTQDIDHGGVGETCPATGVVARGAGSSVVRRGGALYGCRAGIQTLLGRPLAGEQLRLFAFGGDQLAFVHVTGGRSAIVGYDLGDRARTFRTTQTDGGDPDEPWTVSDLVIAPNGNAAWMAAPRGARDRSMVFARGPRRVVQVDSGDLRAGSLRLLPGGDARDDGAWPGFTYKDAEGVDRQSGF
ncbi:MAG TPA: serine/threonine-protein kinase, partial [Baekduia sp.]|nr:serine/threonine-protein kinase [Baekduia sp.]